MSAWGFWGLGLAVLPLLNPGLGQLYYVWQTALLCGVTTEAHMGSFAQNGGRVLPSWSRLPCLRNCRKVEFTCTCPDCLLEQRMCSRDHWQGDAILFGFFQRIGQIFG